MGTEDEIEMKIIMPTPTSAVARGFKSILSTTSLATLLGVGLLGASAAWAADLPAGAPIFKAPPAVATYDRSGFYVGAGLGFRSSDAAADVNSARDTTFPAVLQDRFVAAGCVAGLPCVRGTQYNDTTFRFSPAVSTG
jgi:hypothetical protein